MKIIMVNTRDWLDAVKQGYRTVRLIPAMIDVFPVVYAVMVRIV